MHIFARFIALCLTILTTASSLVAMDCTFEPVMEHLAIVPDGNRRWAKHNKLETLRGHHTGLSKFHDAIAVCLKNKIPHLSIYTISLENLTNRKQEEVEALIYLLNTEFLAQLPRFEKNRVRIRFVGNRKLFPKESLETIHTLEEQTKTHNNLTLHLLFCYSGIPDLVQAVQQTVALANQGKIKPEDITQDFLYSQLWTHTIPDPSLIIRTGCDNQRLSGFYIPQASYTELMFLPKLWPEIIEDDLQVCIDRFKAIKRNFGK